MANSSAAGATAGPLSALPADLTPLLQGRCVVYIATRNAALEPLSTIAFGLQPASDGREVTVFLPAALSPPILANLRDNGQMAVTLVRPSDHRALQIKGVWAGERRTGEEDRAFLAQHRDEMLQEMGQVGVPRSAWRRLAWWPCLALRMEVRDTFVQTPGPSAGQRCEAAAPPAKVAPKTATTTTTTKGGAGRR
jgi:hypothetical protein